MFDMVKATEKFTVLRDWYLQPQGSKYPRICGMAPKAGKDGAERAQKVTAGRVVKRVRKSRIATSSGSLYELSGSIDAARMSENGFSASFVHIFRCGFPPNWEFFLQDELDRIVPCKPAVQEFAVPVSPKPVKTHRVSKKPCKPPKEKKPTEKKIIKKRTVKWYKNTLNAVTTIPSAKKRAAAVLFSPLSEQPAQLPQADWSEANMDEDFTPMTFLDTTRTFRMSAGRRSGQKPAYIASNADKGADRVNFRGYLDREKQQQKKRNISENVSRNGSEWSRNESSRRDFGKKLQIPALPEEDD